MFHTSNPSEFPAKWEGDYLQDYSWADWADDRAKPYCGECGTDDPDEISSHHPACTVAEDMREAFDREHPGFNDTLAEQTGADR
jgi:hypothetical protein